ncbi:hypothetical protein [Paenibacillus sp. HW567]|uniref:hypothetical protein n=1 Tax=Paenibacillus sp. HW567 TaxID=1034769 RepID=UPI0003AAA3E7
MKKIKYLLMFLLIFTTVPLSNVFAATEDYYLGDLGFDSNKTVSHFYFTDSFSGVAANRVDVFDKNNVLLKTFTNPGFNDALTVSNFNVRYIVVYFTNSPVTMAYATNGSGNKLTLVKNGAIPVLTPSPKPTTEPIPTPTSSPVPTATPTPTPIATATPTPSATPTATPEQPTGDRAMLTITFMNGTEKEYDLQMSEVDAFLNWYDARDAGRGPGSYAIDKHTNNKGPFSKRKDYVVFDKILTFEVSEYTAQ